MFEPRRYQTRALDNIDKAEKAGVRRGLVVHPTGTGKTVTYSHLIKRRAGRGRAAVLVHREELANQGREKLALVAPELEVGLVKGDEGNDVDAPVVLISVPTAQSEKRLAQLMEAHRRSPFATIVADEAHHAPSPSWTRVLTGLGAWHPYGPLAIGFTSTPERDNGKTLGVWEKVVDFMSIREAIYGDPKKKEEGGYLVPILPAVVVQTDMEMGRVTKGRDGDFSEGDLGRELENSGAIAQIADAFVTNAFDRKGIAFTPTVKTAHALAAALRARGIRAEALDGTTHKDARKGILARLKTGETQVVVNCGVLTEGFDEPSISVVVVARPTKFHGLYVQMIGRGTRKHPGKKNLMILDLVGASQRHEFIGWVDLGLDLDEERKKRDGDATPQECAYCGTHLCVIPEHRCALCQRRLPVSLIKEGAGRHDNCRAKAGGQVDVFGASKLRWLPLPGESWCLGSENEVIVMAPVGTGTWKLAAYGGGHLDILHEELPSDWAMNIGEDRVKAFMKLSERKARWLNEPVTPAQKNALMREGLPESSLVKVRTKGQAADLMTRIYGRRAVRKLGVPV